MSQKNTVIEIRNLTKKYSSNTVLDGVNITVEQWAVYGLLWRNGAGKTTTLKILTGIINKTEWGVKIFWEDWKLNHLESMGSLIERPMLYSNATGYENLKIHAYTSGVSNIKRINEVLNIVWLDDKASRKLTSQYSLGMKQRLAIWVALLHKPKILILDEPTNWLDIEWIREIRDLVWSLSKSGITTIISSHALSEIEKICSHIWVFSKGKICFEWTKEEFMKLWSDIEENYLSLTK